MRTIKISRPSMGLWKEFDNRIRDFHKEQSVLKNQALSLSTIRDSLLPKLISGEMEVGA
jgi:hypothetical protein